MVKLSFNSLRYEKKIWNTLLTHLAPEQDCSDQQASKLLLISHWLERPKGKSVQTLQWHDVNLGCQDDNLCACQDDLFLQNGSIHIPFSNHEILKIQTANNDQKCIVLAATKQLYEWFSLSVCLSVRPSVCHTFFTMFPLLYHHEIFMIYYQWQRWRPCKRSRSEVKGQGHRDQNPI